jgi:hypothetical protein
MGPILSAALASVGKGFLTKGLLNGNAKETDDNTENLGVEAIGSDSNENNTEDNNSYSANDDNPQMLDEETEGVIDNADMPEANTDIADIADTDIADTDIADIADIAAPETTVNDTVNDEFSADNVVIPGEQEATQEAEQASFGVEDTNGSGGISTAPTVVPESTPQYLENAELPTEEVNLPSIANENMNATNDAIPSLSSNELVEAIENKDPVAVENAIESNPVEAESILKDDTALDNEAVQAIDGGNDAEVNNEVVEEALKQDPEELIGTRPNFHENDPAIERMQARIDRLNNEKDEDFLGPDEYIDENGNIQVDPNWKPEDADEDFVGPDEQLAVIDQTKEDFVEPDKQLAIYNGDVPEEIYSEPVYDTSDYNFDWDYDIETLGVASPEEIPNAPVKNKDQAKAKQRLMNWFKSHKGVPAGGVPVGSVSPMTSNDTSNDRLSMAGRTAGALTSAVNSPSGSVSSTSMSASGTKPSTTSTTTAKTGGGTLPVAVEDNFGNAKQIKSTTPRFSNGSMSSGSFGLMRKNKNNNIKVEKQDLPSKFERTAGAGNADITNMKDALVERLINLVDQLSDDERKQLGITGNNYKGTSFKQLDGFTIQELIEKIENYLGR